MARIEKTVFISYRRKDISWALAVYQYLTSQKYDVFFDYTSLSGGDFEQVIVSNIRARAHFVLILTPTALDRVDEPGDWLRREIETAIDEKRNIIPLFFDGFNFGSTSVAEKLTGKLSNIKRYNGLDVPSGYFMEAMERLHSRYLNIPLNAVIHPVSTEVRKVVKGEQVAAEKALLQRKEAIEELVKPADEYLSVSSSPRDGELVRIGKLFKLRSYGIGLGIFLFAVVGVFSLNSVIQYLGKGETPASTTISLSLPTAEEFLPTSTQIIHLTTSATPPSVPSSDVPMVTVSVGTNCRSGPGTQYELLGSLPVGDEAEVVGKYSNYLIIRNPTIDGFCWLWNGYAVVDGDISTVPEYVPPSTPTQTAGIGSTIISDKDSMTLLYVPAGEFIMGSNDGEGDEKPVHAVYLDAFWIDQTEVTNAMFADCVQDGRCEEPSDNPYYSDSNYASHPVVYVTWNDANNYCSWADRRLPTEAQWEKAASWDDLNQIKNKYPWGDTIDCSFANYHTGSKYCVGATTVVGSYPKGISPYGAFDMAGNIWEWVADWYDETYYQISPFANPSGPDSGQYRVLRGGAYSLIGSNARSADRTGSIPYKGSDMGFRCVRSE